MSKLKASNRGKRIEARNPLDLEGAWDRYYTRLAEHFVSQIKMGNLQLILEAGCGRGQLTIPLLRLIPRQVQMIAIDSSRGPYKGWLGELEEKLKGDPLEKRVRVIKADVRKMREVTDQSVDVVVSNELLCDLPYDRELERALGEFRRILRPNGLMIHGEWSSSPAVDLGSFLVKHWPSWNPDQLFPTMRKYGFHEFEVSYFDTTIHFGYQNAVAELRSWGADDRILKQNERVLKRHGLDLPFEHIIRCEKDAAQG